MFTSTTNVHKCAQRTKYTQHWRVVESRVMLLFLQKGSSTDEGPFSLRSWGVRKALSLCTFLRGFHLTNKEEKAWYLKKAHCAHCTGNLQGGLKYVSIEHVAKMQRATPS